MTRPWGVDCNNGDAVVVDTNSPTGFSFAAPTVASHTHAAADVTGTAVVTSDARLSDARTPTAHTHAAGDVTGTAVVTNDARLSDARTPTAHAASHKNGGADEVATATAGANAIPKAGSGGTLAIGWLPTGTTSSTVAIGNDARLSDARTPTAHAATHNSGGTDALAIDAAAGTGSLRTLGTAGTNACAGNDSRLSDARTPSAHKTTHLSDGTDPLGSPTAATSATTGTMSVTMPTHDGVLTITPTGACTFTASGGKGGARATFVVTTSGTSSFVLTWGTNFKVTATLATGTTTAKVFTVSFVCKDGTTWCETGRTTAM